MKINFDKIRKIYGEEYIEVIDENIENVKLNIEYMQEIGFSDIEDVFERVTPLFLTDNESFREKIRELVLKLGINYVEAIENDLGLLEELL